MSGEVIDVKKIRVGIMTMSDGREHIHKDMLSVNRQYQADLATALEASGEIEAVCARKIINSNAAAKEEGEYLLREEVEVTVFNYAIWCYPQYSVVATNFAPGPYVLFSNLHPSKCGMVGMLAASGSLEQLGIKHTRIWGDVSDYKVLGSIVSYIKAAVAVRRLRGLTFGNFGGRPLGMYTAVANPEQWQRLFGIDVENIEQEDIVRAGNAVSDDKVNSALKWLEDRCSEVKYNGKNLTPEKLKLQIRSYYGLRNIIDRRGLDFIGIKAHGDVTENYVTMDVAEAFLNDPYDMDGPHEPIVAATEADMDGALTMQIFKHLSGSPVLFADVRHYDADNDIWYFSNSGTHATFFAGGSFNPVNNLKNVKLLPETEDYPAGGASVWHIAKAGRVTLARLSRKNGQYRMTIVPAEFVRFEPEKEAVLAGVATPQWPVAFTRLKVSAEEFISKFPCNHIHGVYGDYVRELKNVADILDIPCEIMDGN